ncbi:hypothetical protein [Chondrinema litorale]|uniref:hypothetical protein n=1 Tax=Chondrinema litorale TaxID=2994555 RepID=UPI0025432147|nr:hypothetical protein [Chondrinema litorale]UZR99247.1 hypothetical protein OQ292_35280 [Chondrinema litorale]
MVKFFTYLLLLLMFTSCAGNYKALYPERFNYTSNTSSSDDYDFYYRYDVLHERENKKYAKKEHKKGIKLVSIKVENKSEQDFVFGKDLIVHSGNTPVTLLEANFIHKQLKQNVPIYLLYLLLTPLEFYSTSSNGSTNSVPIGLALGPGITVLQMGIAGSANGKFRQDLEIYLLNGKTIPAGETVYGLIGIVDYGYNQLILK